MRQFSSGERGRLTAWVLGLTALLAAAPIAAQGEEEIPRSSPECDIDNGGITLPDGFCAVVAGDGLDRIRHIAVRDNGDIYTTLSLSGHRTSVIALRDTTGDGRADVEARFGEIGGSGVIVRGDELYFASVGRLRPQVLPWFPLYRRATAKALAVLGLLVVGTGVMYRRTRRRGWLVALALFLVTGAVLLLNVGVREVRQVQADRLPHSDHVLRYTLPPDGLAPTGPPDTIVRGLPTAPLHYAKALVLDEADNLFVTVGSLTDSCQGEDRTAGARGIDPCPELETRAGVWRFNADRTGQTQADGEHYATGLRNTFALARHPRSGVLFAVPHGRDGLAQYWPEYFTLEEGGAKPSEEMFRVEKDGDYGWPYCYHDPELGHQVLAPEYGGDGRTAGRCAETDEPVLAFPAHWAPMDMLFYTGEQFPERYRRGAFVAFHGSSNRAPLPQEGYHVVYVPFEDGSPTGSYEVFARGFEGEIAQPGAADHRPTGLAQGPDGSLYVSDDKGGRIWRIVYRGSGPPGAGPGG